MNRNDMDRLFDRPVSLGIGPAHGGAAWVHDYLRRRGDICLPEGVREIFYFDRHFQRGPEFYVSHYLPQARHVLIAEMTTTIFDHPEAPRRVYELFGPHVRLLCPLRDPVERAAAAYHQYLRYGIVKGDIEEAARQVPQILTASRYADHAERWLGLFGRNAIRFVFHEKLQADPAAYTREVCEGLGISYRSPFKGVRGWAAWLRAQKRGNPLSLLSQQERDWLAARLGMEKSRLEKITKTM